MSAPIVRWEVSRYGHEPKRHEFVRETEYFYFYEYRGKVRREAKVSRYSSFYNSEQEALDAIARINEQESDQKKLRRIRDAAPLMLAALQEVETYLAEREDVIDGDYGQPAPNAEMTLLLEVRAALANARGAKS